MKKRKALFVNSNVAGHEMSNNVAVKKLKK